MGNDTISSGTASETVYGGQGDDVITGHSAAGSAQVLSGDLGNDSITAGSGADTLIGGAGSDTLTLGSGHDVIYEHLSDSTVNASNSTTTTTTVSGGDTMSSSTTTTTVDGSNLDHVIGTFTSGTDHLVFGGHNDAVFGAGPGLTVNAVQTTLNDPGSAEAELTQAYDYAFGGSYTNTTTGTTTTYSNHFTSGTEYVAVVEGSHTFVFTADGQAVELESAHTFATGDILGAAS